MSASSTSTPTASFSAEQGIPPAEIDASCRGPVLFLFTKAAGWLVVASVFGFIGSLKFHAPYLLASSAWLTYGRVQPVAVNALVYGFAAQAGLGVTLWLLARLGRTTLVQPGYVLVGAGIWNLGVALGVLGILIGDGTGFEWLEMPPYASPVLFSAYLLIAICALLTFHRRAERRLYPSQWFLLAALFWFPWIYSTGNLLLFFLPVRGVLQAVVNWWFLHNLATVWFGCLGIASIFYFIPKLTGRPLPSEQLAMFALWTLLLFGSWGGVHPGAPVPSWIPGLSTVGTVLSLVPVIAVALNCDGTLAGNLARLRDQAPLRFVAVGTVAYVLAGVLGAVHSLPAVSRVTQFTFFVPALSQLYLQGFFCLVTFGAIYYIAPKIAGADWPCAGSVKWHFRLAVSGLAVSCLALVIGGLAQGQILNDPGAPFLDSLRAGLRLFRVSTLGDLLMLVGSLLLAGNLMRLWCRSYCQGCVKSLRDAVKPEPVEARP